MNNYFAVLGRNKALSLYELESLGCKDIESHGGWISFSHDSYEMLTFCGGCVKWGRIIEESEIAKLCEGVVIVGVSDKNLGTYCKKECGVRRWKEVDLVKTDLEIKTKGIEFLSLHDDLIGFVEHYQQIPRLEAIDFERPVRGMQIGMMPAKLTQILVNIGVGVGGKGKDSTVFDPFCGFATTGFVANSNGLNFIGSDINPTPAKQNLPRRKTQSYWNEKHFTVFKHDVLNEFTQPFLTNVSCIVTEGRLGPILSNKAVNQLSRPQLNERREAIEAIYNGFLDSLQTVFTNVPIVITYPQRTFTDEDLSTVFIKKAQGMGYTVSQAGDIYTRKGQNVGRRILVLVK